MAKKKHQKDIHHRKPSSIGGTNDDRNLSIVRKNHHVFWHGLFNNNNAHQIAQYINDVWLDPAYIFICEKRETKNKRPPS